MKSDIATNLDLDKVSLTMILIRQVFYTNGRRTQFSNFRFIYQYNHILQHVDHSINFPLIKDGTVCILYLSN